ncbi:hypothetical protein E1200_27870, partial [Actinomadura sp. GC306]|uniref:hypothetical protein n=1 Tax=Actinomadura sp. GC306 TaxID=2530367 RepID=UPI00104E684B
MDSPDEHLLKQTIERLTQENAKLRSQLAVTEQWNPPIDLEHDFRTAMGWKCVMVPLLPDRPTLILITGTEPGTGQDATEAGDVWRHLQTAAVPPGRIGPSARAQMPARLLGYLRVHGDRTIIVLNRDLRRGQVSRAARILRANARTRRPRLLELSAAPFLGLYALYKYSSAKSIVGLSAAVAPATTIALSIAIAPSTTQYLEPPPSPGHTQSTSNVTQSDEETVRPASERPPTPSDEKRRKVLASAESSRKAVSTSVPACPAPTISPDRRP